MSVQKIFLVCINLINQTFDLTLDNTAKFEIFRGEINWRTDRRRGLPKFFLGPFGVTNLKVCSQKIVPIFLFFCLGRDPLGTCDKPRLWGRKNFRGFQEKNILV
jgi:hypothetical protein